MSQGFDPKEKTAIWVFIGVLLLIVVYFSTHEVPWNSSNSSISEGPTTVESEGSATMESEGSATMESESSTTVEEPSERIYVEESAEPAGEIRERAPESEPKEPVETPSERYQ